MDISIKDSDGHENRVRESVPAVKKVGASGHVAPSGGMMTGGFTLPHVNAYLKEQQGRGAAQVRTRESNIKAGQLMRSPVVTLPNTMKKVEAREMFKRHDFHHFPVVDGDGVLVGLLSDIDLLRDEPNARHRLPGEEAPGDLTAVGSVMSTRLMVAHVDTCICDIGKVMLSENIKCIPIVDAENRPAGIVTSTDFVRCMINYHAVDNFV